MHLGAGDVSRERERLLVQWLDGASADAKALFFVGDVFDFWFEYKRVVPKGFVRLFGKLAELADRGIELHFFPGNHDMWGGDYFRGEVGAVVHEKPSLFTLNGRNLFIGHGHDLERKKGWYERSMRWAFHLPAARRAFAKLVHPDSAMRFGAWWSGKSREAKKYAHVFRGEEESLIRFARSYEREHPEVDYFVFGHVHCMEDYDLGNGRRAIFLGEWMENPACAVLDEEGEIALNNVVTNYGL